MSQIARPLQDLPKEFQVEVSFNKGNRPSAAWARLGDATGSLEICCESHLDRIKSLNPLHWKFLFFLFVICSAYLVPVFSFGENELFKQIGNPEGSWLRSLQNRMQKIMRFSMPLFYARGIFQYNFGILPYRKPIHSVGMYIKD